MKFAAIYRSYMLRAPAVGAEDAVIGAWTRLLVHAADIEAGVGVEKATRYRRLGVARIRGCKGWDEQQWLRSTGTTGVASVVAIGLARWRGGDLIVEGYDLWGQRVSAIHLQRLQEYANPAKAQANAQASPQQDPAYAGSTSMVQIGGPLAQLPSPPLPSDPDLPSDARAESALPSPEGGAGGGEGQGRGEQRAPHGAGDPGTGPEGFERWWVEFCSIRPCKPWWKPLVMEQWAAEDLEGEADEIRAFCLWKARNAWNRRPRGPEGQSMIPTPRKLLAAGAWRKRGPWNAPPAAPPPRPASSSSRPEVVNVGLVDVTAAHGWLDQLLGDPEIDEPTKERHRRSWAEAHPGQTPPWQAANGRTS